MKESEFQHRLINEIKMRFPESIVMKLDSSYCQGIPDLLVLFGSHWACLECKRSKSASRQPNQEYYIDKMNNMSFAAFIYPENKEEVLYAMERSFQA